MMSVHCIWDQTKNLANHGKNGITFEEVAGMFTSGQDYLELFDAEHSTLKEDRFLAIGRIKRGFVTVVWTEPRDNVVRIISARPATWREQAMFEEHIRGCYGRYT